MSSDRFARARVLLEQNRHDLAIKEITARLADDPDDAEGFILLALCQAALDKPEAWDTARRAVELAPDEDRAHFVFSLAELKRHDYAAAEAAIRTAIGMNSWNPGYFGQLAAVHIAQYRWADALSAADEGLAIDPDDGVCLNNRAVALTKLGRQADAARTLEGTLEKQPEDAFTHANRGWSLLHENEPRPALVHFRESLRLDPNSAWAKEGMLEALRAKNWFYRRVLQAFLWLGRFPPRVQFALLIGMYVLVRVLGAVREEVPPAAQPVLLVVLLGYLLFVAGMWFARPFMNVVLMTTADGRMLLDRSEKWASAVTTGLAVAALGAGVGAVILNENRLFLLAVLLLVAAVHFASVFGIPAGRYRWLGAAASVAVVLGMVGHAAVSAVVAADGEAWLRKATEHDRKAALHRQPPPTPEQFAERTLRGDPDRQAPSLPPELIAERLRLENEGIQLRQIRSTLDDLESLLLFASVGVLILHSVLRNRATRIEYR